ncbi:titin-like [Wyeomyia smithii]|uniref:titin-like n=1 Tax=Wyeomyia smithii TaxID=174621 RepID=UPI002467E819|nr:titin-like [Wyeomyia smithii]
MNRGMGTPQRDVESLTEQARATKSGRKVKRPAHFDDSPETKKAAPASSKKAAVLQNVESPTVKPEAEIGKKSARKTILKSLDDTPSKNGVLEPETTKKSARKTLLVDEQMLDKKSARKTASKQVETTPTKDKTPEPEIGKKSAKKTLLKSAVKNASVEQEKGTPKKKAELTAAEKQSTKQEEMEAVVLEAGTSRTGRKIKVPAHLKEFEEVVVASPKKETAEKLVSRKSSAPIPKKDTPEPIEEKTIPKTPGRGKSLAVLRKESGTEPEEEKKSTLKTPRRGKSLAMRGEPELESDETSTMGKPFVSLTKTSSLDLEDDKTSKVGKTPKRGKSLASALMEPELGNELTPSKREVTVKSMLKTADINKVISINLVKHVGTEDNISPKKATPTSSETMQFSPLKRGKLMVVATQVATPENATKTNKTADNLGEPISRSGRKIKPKKYFGEFEEEEPVSIVAKTVSPNKVIPKMSPLAKKDSSQKPKVLSPTKRLSPSMKEHSRTEISPPKKIKLDPLPRVSPKVNKISPNTEERQITVRGGNDHHHGVDKHSDDTSPANSSKETADTSSGESTSNKVPVERIQSNQDKTSPAKATSKQEKQSEQKVKRARKTLPAADEQAPSEKVPKTPSRRVTSAVLTVLPVPTDEAAINSRSGRKIKPKKFFGEDETAVTVSASKAKTVVKPEGGRGRRKTLAAEFSSDAQEKSSGDETSTSKKDDAKIEGAPSCDEILTVMGASQSVVSIAGDTPEAEMPAAACEDQDHQQQLSGEKLSEVTETEQDKLDREELFDSVEAALEENFQDTRIEQTAPAPQQMIKLPPNDPAPLVEQDLLPQLADSSDPAVEADPEPSAEVLPCGEKEGSIPKDLSTAEIQESDEIIQDDVLDVPQEFGEQPTESQQEPDNTPSAECDVDEPSINATVNCQKAEISAGSCFSEALQVDEELAPTQNVNNSKDEHFECLEFLENSVAAVIPETEQLLSETPISANGMLNSNITDNELASATLDDQQLVEPVDNFDEAQTEQAETSATPEIEDDLNDTKPPDMNDIDLDDEEIPDHINCTYTENDRDNESIIVIPDTPMIPNVNSSVPAAPKTPESKAAMSEEKFSPDKPEQQQQPSVPLQVIEIFDSPIAADDASERTDIKSTTSTPLKQAKDAPAKLTAMERIIQNSRKRSLSAGDAEVSKKNVTFHSPANSTILVDTIDERLKKSVNKTGSNQRKRSLSEHRDLTVSDGVKPAKVTKLPNFRSIHQQQFNRMESIQEFHNRKVQRAKVLATSGAKSPAAASLIKSDSNTPHKSTVVPVKSPFKSGNGTSSVKTKSFISRPKIGGMKPLSDNDRMEKRQQQFQAAFKPKVVSSSSCSSSSSSSSSKDTSDGARRIIEQSRHKQSQILKGVRTNKRFELLMKFRDTQE